LAAGADQEKTFLYIFRFEIKYITKAMNNKTILSILFLTVLSFAGFSQDNLEEAKHILNDESGQNKKVIELLQKELSANPSNSEATYLLGIAYLHSSEKSKALKYLEKSASTQSPERSFLLARAYHLNMQFEKAIEQYISYKNYLDSKKSGTIKLDNTIGTLMVNESPDVNGEMSIQNPSRLLDKRILECRNGIDLVKRPVQVKIQSLGIKLNSDKPDYAPIISADESELYFTSRRNVAGGIDPFDELPYEDIYRSYNINNQWSEASNVGAPLNSKKHDAALGLSADGQTIFLFLNGDIYQSRLEGDQWQKPVKLNENINSSSTEHSISLSADERSLVFTRDGNGGLGGRDIYLSQKDEKGSWGPSKNLGSSINTVWDEDGLFLHPDGKTLYFSSNGHNSMGGYDIFKAVYKDGVWGQPVNMGYPINTPDDDIFFVLSASGEMGYFSSARAGGAGENDIYSVSIPKTGKKEQPFSPLTLVTGSITDEKSKAPTEAGIQIIDNEKNEVVAELVSNSKTGKYVVSLPSGKNYGIAVVKDDYLFHSENFVIEPAKDFRKVDKPIELKKAKPGTRIALNNIFFDSDKFDLRPESQNELNRLSQFLKAFPEVQIQINGYTDDKGEETYNKTLSQKRAESVLQALVKRGVGADRLKAVGFGESMPIAANKNRDGTENLEGMALNRRIEFEILKN
jgi:outer membrane protein OmpA-like peptidoglycan-associated protein/tetratricopeptide (TPR) repeat protein